MAPPSRREFLAASAALTLLSACGGSSPSVNAANAEPPAIPENRSEVFRHGVASGDPLTDRAIVWTRVTTDAASAAGVVNIYRDPEITSLVRSVNYSTDASRDFTVKLDVDQLEAGQAYYYQFAFQGNLSPIGRLRTLPLQTDRARLGIATCGDYSRGLWNAYARLAQQNDLDVVIHLGDYIYETARDDVRAHQPAVEITTLEEYRARYASYRIEPELQEVHRQHSMIWVWDDHETVNGSWNGGAEDHEPEVDGDYSERKAAAQQAIDEWLPIRLPDANNPERIYRQFAWGDLIDLFMLDTRIIGREEQGPNSVNGDFFRQTEPPFNDPNRQMLGVEQERWFTEGLVASQARTARWRLIGNQVVFSQIKVTGQPDDSGAIYANNDQWDGYKAARTRVLDTIENNGVNNVVFLTGDVHASMVYEASRDPHDGSYVPGTGMGSFATEFVAPSISSAGDVVTDPNNPGDSADGVVLIGADVLRANNPQMRYIEATRNGYCIADIDRQRVQMEYWLVPTVTEENSTQTNEVNFQVASGNAAVVENNPAATMEREGAPMPAPAGGEVVGVNTA